MINGVRIVTIAMEETHLIDGLAQLTYEAFQEHAPDWLPTLEDARTQVLKALLPDRVCRGLVDSHGQPLGWIGAIPVSHGRIWEIHPLAIAVHAQGKHYGRLLVREVERLALQSGALGMLVGTADATGATTLASVDLYENPLEALRTLKTIRSHPYDFWVKVGYTVVGVVPDAEGRGKPGITLAKRIG